MQEGNSQVSRNIEKKIREILGKYAVRCGDYKQLLEELVGLFLKGGNWWDKRQ